MWKERGFFEDDPEKPDLLYFIEIIIQLQPAHLLQDAGAYSDPCQTSEMELVCENS